MKFRSRLNIKYQNIIYQNYKSCMVGGKIILKVRLCIRILFIFENFNHSFWLHHTMTSTVIRLCAQQALHCHGNHMDTYVLFMITLYRQNFLIVNWTITMNNIGSALDVWLSAIDNQLLEYRPNAILSIWGGCWIILNINRCNCTFSHNKFPHKVAAAI